MNQQDTQVATPIQKQKKKIKWWYPGKKSNHYDWKSFSVITRKWNKPDGIRFQIGPADYFDNRLSITIGLCWISFYLHLPIYSTITDECETPEYGFYYHNSSLVIQYGMKNKFIYMPWDLDWIRTSKLRVDGTWSTERKGEWKKWRKNNPEKSMSDQWKAEKDAEGELWQETHHYFYKTKYGEIQDDVEATIKVSEMEWRPRWFRWTKLFNKVKKSIDIEFSNEVGSERGSWKGGTIGCSYEILPGETPYETLMRMQKERTFDR